MKNCDYLQQTAERWPKKIYSLLLPCGIPSLKVSMGKSLLLCQWHLDSAGVGCQIPRGKFLWEKLLRTGKGNVHGRNGAEASLCMHPHIYD